MYDAVQIANFFIQKGINTNNPVTPMKLQKLLYFAYGWYYATNGDKLFDESVQAWKYGPVIKSVYDVTKQYGNQPILGLISVCEDSENCTPIVDPTDTELSNFLNSIWDVYGKYDGIQLANLTHENGSPWQIVISKHHGHIPKNKAIDDDIIKTFFVNFKNKVEGSNGGVVTTTTDF